MKLNRQQITALSTLVVEELGRLKLIRLIKPEDEAISAVVDAVTDDLQVEDRLNDEVNELLKKYKSEMDQGRMDYKTMFDMVKKELVKKRGLVL